MNKDQQRDEMEGLLTDVKVTFRKRGNPHFKYLKWVLTAVSEESDRRALWCVVVEDGNMLATDGRRLHRCPKLPSMEDGVWWPAVNKADMVELIKTTEVIYPRYKEVIPDDDVGLGRIKSREVVAYDHEGPLQMRLDVAMNTTFIRDVCWGGGVLAKDKKAYCDVYTTKPTKAHSSMEPMPGPVTFHFAEWSRFAIIMPIRMSA